MIETIFAEIDKLNSSDPTLHEGKPLAMVHGQLGSKWLAALQSDPSDILQIAVRGHHLCRWELKRSDYEEGRAGYLRWRRDNKKHQAKTMDAILASHGLGDDDRQRANYLLLRKGLGKDEETQTLEDCACLAFLETQMDDMVTRLGHDHMVNVVKKTLKKMSTEAIELAGNITVSAASSKVLQEAAS